MKTRQGFYQDDLVLFYFSNDTPTDVAKLDFIDALHFNKGMYKLHFVFSGDDMLTYNSKRTRLNDGALIIGADTDSFSLERRSNKKREYLYCYVHKSLFKNSSGDKNFLRVFDGLPSEKKIFYPKDFPTQTCFELLKSLKEALFLKLGRVHIKSRVLSIVSELDILYDKTSTLAEDASDNIGVNIVKYIHNHFANDISLADIEEEFFVSSTTINTYLKSLTKQTFHSYLNKVRVDEVLKLVKAKHSVSYKSAAELCGFNNYSSFFRAYKRIYGTAPTE